MGLGWANSCEHVEDDNELRPFPSYIVGVRPRHTTGAYPTERHLASSGHGVRVLSLSKSVQTPVAGLIARAKSPGTCKAGSLDEYGLNPPRG